MADKVEKDGSEATSTVDQPPSEAEPKDANPAATDQSNSPPGEAMATGEESAADQPSSKPTGPPPPGPIGILTKPKIDYVRCPQSSLYAMVSFACNPPPSPTHPPRWVKMAWKRKSSPNLLNVSTLLSARTANSQSKSQLPSALLVGVQPVEGVWLYSMFHIHADCCSKIRLELEATLMSTLVSLPPPFVVAWF